jgi:hypothetical protein
MSVFLALPNNDAPVASFKERGLNAFRPGCAGDLPISAFPYVQPCIYDYRNNFVPSTTYNALAPVVNNNLHLYGMAQAEHSRKDDCRMESFSAKSGPFGGNSPGKHDLVQIRTLTGPSDW